MEEFRVLKEERSGQVVEKKSRFIYYAFEITSQQQAEEIIEGLRKKFFDAKHVVFAYRLFGDNGIYEKQTDDGEPSGTAGMPILNVLKKQNVTNVLVVVVRYFGGVLLGTGGLTHVYSECAKLAIEENLCVCKIYEKFEFEISYKDQKNFEFCILQNGGKVLSKQFGQCIEYVIGLEKEIPKEKLTNAKVEVLKMEKLNEKVYLKI